MSNKITWTLDVLGYCQHVDPTTVMHLLENNRGKQGYLYTLAELMIRAFDPAEIRCVMTQYSPRLGMSIDTFIRKHPQGALKICEMWVEEIRKRQPS